jgi:hypothetical protein
MSNARQERFLQVDGIRLHWTEFGTSSPVPPVVLLHGLNNSSLSWAHVAPLLATDRRALVPDLPGHGESSRPDVGYELVWYAHIIAGWLKALGIQRGQVANGNDVHDVHCSTGFCDRVGEADCSDSRTKHPNARTLNPCSPQRQRGVEASGPARIELRGLFVHSVDAAPRTICAQICGRRMNCANFLRPRGVEALDGGPILAHRLLMDNASAFHVCNGAVGRFT